MDPLLLGLGALMLLGGKRSARVGSVDDQAAPPANNDGTPMSDAPPVYAYLYQLPDDSFSTTRMAFGPQGAVPQEMGIFDSPGAAAKVAGQNGWKMAWNGVRQLSTRPGT